MPSRIVSIAILVYWLIAASLLLTRDVLPELSAGYPPDLYAIASAGRRDQSVQWTIQVVDDPKNAESRRTIGAAVTRSQPRGDGGYTMTSDVSIDSEGLLKGTPFAAIAVGRLAVDSRYEIDSKGNLQALLLEVASEELAEFRLTVKGRIVGPAPGDADPDPSRRFLELAFESRGIGRIPGLDQVRRFEYTPGSVVGNTFGPLDRLPRLRVGQRWETRVVNPITGRVDQIRVEVVKRTLIHWNNEPVSTFEVVQSLPPLSTARSWVRTDGAILRQEVPFPFVRLLLERRRDSDGTDESKADAP